MFVLLVCMGQSPYNRSIWLGMARGFEKQGCKVQVVDATQIPPPGSLDVLPDLLFVVHGGNTPQEAVRQYKQAGVPTAVFLLDEPYEVDQSVLWARHYDWVFPVDRSTVETHRQHSHAAHLPCGYDDTVFCPDGPTIKSSILMLGSCFTTRENLLAASIKRFGHLFTWVGPGWHQISPAGVHYDRLVTPEECAMFYRGADITLNIHRDATWSHFGELNKQKLEATHLNPRFWEAAACGGFPLCSYRADLENYAKGAASFSSEEELARKLGYFTSNAKVRKKQAQLLLKAVRKHSYCERAKTVLDLVSTK